MFVDWNPPLDEYGQVLGEVYDHLLESFFVSPPPGLYGYSPRRNFAERKFRGKSHVVFSHWAFGFFFFFIRATVFGTVDPHVLAIPLR